MTGLDHDERTALPGTVASNIEAVHALEADIDHVSSRVERLAHTLGEFVGSVPFAIIHLVAFVLWVGLNAGPWPRMHFDPYPFAFMGTLVSFEAVILTTFVLIKQNALGARAEQRARLDLQINLLTEKEVTKLLQMLAAQSGGQNADPEIEEMLQSTRVDHMAEHLAPRHDPA